MRPDVGLIGLLGVIVAGSLAPANWPLVASVPPLVHSVGHLFLYAALGVLLMQAATVMTRGRHPGWVTVGVLAVTMLGSGVLELLQAIVGRVPGLGDVLLNGVGVLVGVVAWHLLQRFGPTGLRGAGGHTG